MRPLFTEDDRQNGTSAVEGYNPATGMKADTADDGLVPLASAVPITEVFHKFWPWVRPDRWWMLTGILFLAVGAAGDVISILLFKNIIDEVLVPRHMAAFWPLGSALLVAALATALATFAGGYTATWVAERFVLRLRSICMSHLHSLPPDTLHTRWHGDVVSRMTFDIASIETFVASGVIQFASALTSLLFFTTAAFFLSWQLALAVLALGPIFWFSSRFFANRIQSRSRRAVRQEGRVTAVVEESLANATLAHAYNQQQHEVARVDTEGRALVRTSMATARYTQAYPAFLEILEVFGGLVVMGVGAYELSQGAITIGGLLAFAAFLSQLFGPASQLSKLASAFGAASAAAERIVELAHMRSPVRQRRHALAPTTWRGEVQCQGVSATYPTLDGELVLQDVTFTVAPGEVLAVMGPSGAGKSTLGKLLVRFMDPAQGVIRLDGIDLRDLTIASVRDTVTLLPQASQTFRASVRDNIAYGRPDATDAEIVQAAEDADAHEFILALPQGYRTVLGQDGLQLSGGQSRRIGIARAFLRATPVLVLDEPTAGLDRDASRRLLTPLRRLMTGRTTLLVTHDPELGAQADTIYTLTAHGTHPTTMPNHHKHHKMSHFHN